MERTKQDKPLISQKRKDEILDDLFEKGYATKDIEVVKNRLTVTIRNLSAKYQLEAEKINQKGTTAAYSIHSYIMRVLTNVVLAQNGKTFEDRDKVMAWLENLPAPMVDELAKHFRLFEKEVSSALEIESINENFIPEVDLTPDSKQSPEESISEKKGVLEKQS